MKPTNEREIDKHGSFRIPARLVVFFIVVVFALSLKYWAGAYSGAKHEIGATFDAKGVSSFALKDDGGRDVATFPVYYKDAVCDWDVEIEALGQKGPKALGAEIWVQSITEDGKPVAWSEVKADGWTVKDSVHGAFGKALAVFDEGTRKTLRAHVRANTLSIVYSRHQWTGRMRLTVNGVAKEIDTWSESFIPEKTEFYAPPSPTDHVENQTGTLRLSPDEIGPETRLSVAKNSGVILKGASFDGESLSVREDGTLRLPSSAKTVWWPAIGIAAATTLALTLVVILLVAPIRKRPLWSFFVFVILAKLWLVGGDEIRASVFDPNGYMLSSINNFWDLAFTTHAYDRQPGYPLFISAGRLFGLPLRVWVELVYCAACLTIATALPRLKLPKWSAALAFFLMVFNPITYPTFAYAYQDIAYAPFLLLFIGCLLHILPHDRRRRLYAACGAGVFGALAWNTRPEHIMIVAILAAFVFLMIFVRWSGKRRLAKSVFSTIGYCLPIGAGILAVTLVLCAVGRTSRLGAFATSNFQMKGVTALYDELLAIKPLKPEAYHPVPTDVRETAYKFSPSFAALKGPLEGPALELYAPMSRADDGIVNDYGTYFFWGLRVAPWYEKQWTDADSLDRMYARCADELRKARENGAYPSRKVYASYVDPDCSLWLPHLGEGMRLYARMLTRTDAEMLNPEAPDVNSDLFNRAALRRAALVKSNAAIGTTNADPRVKTMKNALAALSAYATYGAVALFVPALVILIVRSVRRLDERTAMAVATIGLVIVAFASRFMLMSVMHASAYHAETRYILPVAPLTGLCFAVFLAVAWEELTRRYNRLKDTHDV